MSIISKTLFNAPLTLPPPQHSPCEAAFHDKWLWKYFNLFCIKRRPLQFVPGWPPRWPELSSQVASKSCCQVL